MVDSCVIEFRNLFAFFFLLIFLWVWIKFLDLSFPSDYLPSFIQHNMFYLWITFYSSCFTKKRIKLWEKKKKTIICVNRWWLWWIGTRHVVKRVVTLEKNMCHKQKLSDVDNIVKKCHIQNSKNKKELGLSWAKLSSSWDWTFL